MSKVSEEIDLTLLAGRVRVLEEFIRVGLSASSLGDLRVWQRMALVTLGIVEEES
jgi:hypothetical protein